MKKTLVLMMAVLMTLGSASGYAWADEVAGNDTETVVEQTEAVVTEPAETEVVETEAAETEVMETEAAETEAPETVAAETETVKTEALEAQASEIEPADDEDPVLVEAGCSITLLFPGEGEFGTTIEAGKDCTLKFKTSGLDRYPGAVIKGEAGLSDDEGTGIASPFPEGKACEVKGSSLVLHGSYLRKNLDQDEDLMITVSVIYKGKEITSDGGWCSVESMPVSDLKISVNDAVYTGQAQTPKVTVKDGKETLEEGKNYKVSYSDNVKIGTGKVTIRGIGNYNGKVTKTFEIGYKCKAPVISKAQVGKYIRLTWGKVDGAEQYRVFRKTGKGKWTVLTDTKDTAWTDKTVKSGTQYTYAVRCVSADGKTLTSAYRKPGTTVVFLSRAKISSVTTPKKGQLALKWKKVSKADGYQIQYSRNSKFSRGNKTVTVKGGKKTSKTISKLTGKKNYYVRVRAYKTVNGKKYYSDWSVKKQIKVR